MSEIDDTTAIGGDGSDVPCVILPMLGHSLIIPTSAVAEMSIVQILESLENSPDWVMGLYPWRGMNVPVVSIESINSKPSPPLNPLGRIAVLNNTGISEEVPYLAIHTQGIPRKVRVTEDSISVNEGADKRPFDAMVVRVETSEYYLPDIRAIETAYIEAMNI